jgi:GT2 family glycosyltransferase
MRNKTFIIIVTYNGIKWLLKCLESAKSYPVIIVDNNSTDEIVNFIKASYPEVILLQQSKNLGFGQANNIGISYALKEGTEHIFLLNQDAYLKDNCLDILIDFQKKNKEYGILSPIHLNGTGTRLDANFSSYVNYSGNKDFFSDYVLNKSIKPIYTVPFVNAAGWLISRECLEIAGGFDPIFFHYGEDDNYCQRVNYHGFKIGVVPEARLLHDRENRSGPEILYGDRKYFQAMERQLKLKYADISKPWDPELDNLIRKRKNAWLKTTIKLDFKKATFFRNEYLMLQRIKSEILLSRKTNKLQGLNYLKFEEQ